MITGLDYSAVKAGLEIADLHLSAEAFADLRELERAVLRIVHEEMS